MANEVWVAVAVAALVIALTALAIRQITKHVRQRRRKPDLGTMMTDAAAELVPLLVQPLAALVKNVGRNRTSIDSLVGPDGTVTVLFSDIEGSTALNSRLGDDEWVRGIRVHDEIVARIVKRHRGQVVKKQGDGFMAAFPTPEDAVGAALSLDPQLHDSPSLDVPLAVRVGVHTGEVVSENGDLFGTNVVMAARIADTARFRQPPRARPWARKAGSHNDPALQGAS